MDNAKKPKIPVILYEEPSVNNEINPIPYITVGIDEEMPPVLFISEYKETGEFEVGSDGDRSPIVDMLIQKYVNLDHLKDKLDHKTYDRVRVALGMDPLKVAQKKGQKILDNVFSNANKNKNKLKTNEEARSERAFKLGEDLRKKNEAFLKENQDKEKETN
jgi:hypothetical protein